MLDELGAVDCRNHQGWRLRRGAQVHVHRASEAPFQDRAIDFSQSILREVVFHTKYDPVRVKKVLHRSTFTQEFRIGSDMKLNTAIPAIDSERALQLLPRLCWHRALLHHKL